MLINDVATDLEYPPEFVKTKGGTYSEAEKEAIKKKYPELHSLFVKDGDLAAVRTQIVRMFEKQKRCEVTLAENETIEAVFKTLLGFKDDLVVKLTSNEVGVRVDMRSRSRKGKSDLGKNAKRLMTLTRELELLLHATSV
mmetsp:Transcript_11683/g.35622  ORF Transcript_11683/g.35622 Transcript_11683/m.35622 type:complete len:140 (+) Transcript_11683:69-488(+)